MNKRYLVHDMPSWPALSLKVLFHAVQTPSHRLPLVHPGIPLGGVDDSPVDVIYCSGARTVAMVVPEYISTKVKGSQAIQRA